MKDEQDNFVVFFDFGLSWVFYGFPEIQHNISEGGKTPPQKGDDAYEGLQQGSLFSW